MFINASADAIKFAGSGQFLIENCFLSRSGASSEFPILRSLNSTLNATASFSTFIFNNVASNPKTILTFPKVINCIVSGSGTNLDGIDAADHTFNLVNVDGVAFRNGSGTSASLGTGETENPVVFVDGTSAGNTFSVVQNFALTAGSPGVDQGTSFNSVNVDILGTTRPQNGSFDIGAFELNPPYWTDDDGSERFSRKFGPGLEIRGTANMLDTRRFKRSKENRQSPFFVTISGPPTIKGQTPDGKPYKAET